MSDFDGVDFFDNLEETKTAGPEVAPTGEYNAKIIATEKYKSKSGNWTLKVTFQVDGGKYRDQNEWYNLWATNEDNKRISGEIFNRLTLAAGFKKYPASHNDYIGKTVKLSLLQFEDEWTNDQGEKVVTNKAKVKYYSPADDGMSPPPEMVPPF